MFTGIIETTGLVKEVIIKGSNHTFWIESSLSSKLKPDQSVSHNGACLTIERNTESGHQVTAISETLEKTNLKDWKADTLVNLERCLQLNTRLDGHLVQGHVDTQGICKSIKEKKGSWEFVFEFPKKFAPLIIEKGSICVNGISLTAFEVKNKSFSVAIIPYTYEHTNIRELKKGDTVNLEFDMVGKYLLRRLSLSKKT
jgi:riboflavin synthase